MNYPKKCPFCEHVADSMDSVADTEAELRAHIETAHTENYPNVNGHTLIREASYWVCTTCNVAFEFPLYTDGVICSG